jgi:hypothetical protein
MKKKERKGCGQSCHPSTWVYKLGKLKSEKRQDVFIETVSDSVGICGDLISLTSLVRTLWLFNYIFHFFFWFINSYTLLYPRDKKNMWPLKVIFLDTHILLICSYFAEFYKTRFHSTSFKCYSVCFCRFLKRRIPSFLTVSNILWVVYRKLF